MAKILNYAQNINKISNENLLINGNFDVWQRGSSFYAGGFTADRWHFQADGGEHKISRLAGNVGLANSTNILRIQTLSSGCYPILSQIVSSDLAIDLRGQNVTFSFYAKKPEYDLTGSVANNWSGAVYGRAYYSTSFDSISEGSVPINNAFCSGSLDNNDWNLYQTSFTVPNNASTLIVEISSELELDENSILDIGQAKLEIGKIATPSSPSTYNIELNKCKEYFQKVEILLKAGTGAGAQSRKFAINSPLPVKPRSQNPKISVVKNNNVLVDSFNTFISNDIFLNASAFSKHPHSELSLELLIDDEILYGKEPGVINTVNIIRGSGKIDVDWNPPFNSDNTISYSILYGTTPNDLINISSFTNSSGSITGLVDSSPYYLKLYSINSYGSSLFSQVFEVAPAYNPPSGIGSLTGVWNFDVTNISWDAPTNDGGSPVTGYRIDRSMYSDFPEISSNPISNETIYTFPSYVGNPPKLTYSSSKFSNELTSTGNYYFRVTPINLAGTGTSTTLTLAKTTPSAPINLSTSVGNGTVILSYLPPASNGGNTISLINLQRSTNSGFTSPISSNHTANYQPITVGSLTNGTGYYFRIRAYNDLGYGPYSESSYAVPNKPITVPGTLTNLSASWVDDDTVSISWSAPLDDGGSPIINYTIYSSSGSNFPSNLTTSITQNSITSLTVDVPITGNYTTFYFRGRANNSIGSSNFSSVASLNKQVPGSTAISSIGVWDTSLSINWNKPISRGSAITGYNVSYSTSSNFSSNVTTLTTTANSLNIGSLTNGTPYYIKVAAVNSVGTGLSHNTVLGTPQSPYSPPSAPTNLTVGELNYGAGANALPVNASSFNGYALYPGWIYSVVINNSYQATNFNYGGIAFTGQIYGSNPYFSFSDFRRAAVHAGVFSSLSSTGVLYIYGGTTNDFLIGSTKNNISSLNSLSTISAQQTFNIVGASTNTGCYYTKGNVTGVTTNTHAPLLNWSGPSNNGGLPITGYEIQYAANSSFSSQLTTLSVPGRLNYYTQCISHSGVDLYARIRAYNATGVSPWSNTAVILGKGLGAPQPPISASASAIGTTGVSLSWTPPSGPIGSGFDSPSNITYRLQYWDQAFPMSQTSLNYSGVTSANVPINGPGTYTLQLQTKNRTYFSNSLNTVIKVVSTTSSPLSWNFLYGQGVYFNTSPPTQAGLSDNIWDRASSVWGSQYGLNNFITADFGAIKTVKAITVGPIASYFGGWGWWYLNLAKIQYSTNNNTWINIATINNSNFNLQDITLNNVVEARYIRVIMDSNNWLGVGTFYFR